MFLKIFTSKHSFYFFNYFNWLLMRVNYIFRGKSHSFIKWNFIKLIIVNLLPWPPSPVATTNSQPPWRFHLSVLLTRPNSPFLQLLKLSLHPFTTWSYLYVYYPLNRKYMPINIWSFNHVLLLDGCQHITLGSCKQWIRHLEKSNQGGSFLNLDWLSKS